MKNTIFLIFVLVSFLFSCKNDTKETSSAQTTSTKDIEPKEEVQSKIVPNLKVNVKDVKQQVDDVTTSFLSKKDTEIFVKKAKDNFFGVYYLIKDDASSVVGKMIVYDDINPYKYDKDTDEFIEINLWKKGIKLFDNSIEVGMSKELLIEKLGKNFKIENDILIFNDESLKGFFKVKEDLITNIKIGLYRDNTANDDILKYEW